MCISECGMIDNYPWGLVSCEEIGSHATINLSYLPWQTALAIKNLVVSKAEALQYLYIADLFSCLDHSAGWCTQYQCCGVNQWCLKWVLFGIFLFPVTKFHAWQTLFMEIIQASLDTCVDDIINAKQILTFSPSVNCIRLLRWPQMSWMKMVQNDLDSHRLPWTEAVDLTQNWPLWSLLATIEDSFKRLPKPQLFMTYCEVSSSS